MAKVTPAALYVWRYTSANSALCDSCVGLLIWCPQELPWQLWDNGCTSLHQIYDQTGVYRLDTSLQVKDPTARVEHEASTSKIGEDQLFYFQQRGIDAEEAVATIISGFCADVFNKLPDEFAEEVNALMSLKLEGSVG